MNIDLQWLLIVVVACCVGVFLFPKIPPLAQLIAAIVGIILVAIVLARAFGVVIG